MMQKRKTKKIFFLMVALMLASIIIVITAKNASATTFSVGLTIEAEQGQLTSPMSSQPGGSGSYVATSANSQGSVTFSFNITQSGSYYIKANVYAQDYGSNSFFISVDGSNTAGNSPDIYDIAPNSGYAWDNVSTRGLEGNETSAENDPLVFNFNSGIHTITFFGRETDTRLDQVKLLLYSSPPPQQINPADTNQDGCVDSSEVFQYEQSYYSGQVSQSQLDDAINIWKECAPPSANPVIYFTNPMPSDTIDVGSLTTINANAFAISGSSISVIKIYADNDLLA